MTDINAQIISQLAKTLRRARKQIAYDLDCTLDSCAPKDEKGNYIISQCDPYALPDVKRKQRVIRAIDKALA